MREITYALYFIKIKKKISLTGIAAAVQEKEQGLTPGPIFFRFIIIIIVIHTSMELSEFYMVKEKKMCACYSSTYSMVQVQNMFEEGVYFANFRKNLLEMFNLNLLCIFFCLFVFDWYCIWHLVWVLFRLGTLNVSRICMETSFTWIRTFQEHALWTVSKQSMNILVLFGFL